MFPLWFEGGIENSDQIPNPIEINPTINPLQVLENWLEMVFDW